MLEGNPIFVTLEYIEKTYYITGEYDSFNNRCLYIKIIDRGETNWIVGKTVGISLSMVKKIEVIRKVLPEDLLL